MSIERELEVVFPSNQDKYSNFKINCSLNQLENVGELKRLIALRFYLPPNNFQLIYNQKHLTDDKQKLVQLFKSPTQRIYAIPILSLTAKSEVIRRANQNEINLESRNNIQLTVSKWMRMASLPLKQYEKEMEQLQLMLEKNNQPVNKKEMKDSLTLHDGNVRSAFDRLIKQ